MNHLQVFENELFKVSARTEGKEILFDAEQVARSLGFTTVAKSGNVTVRWSRVNSYLPQNSPQVAKGDFIPEPLVYKLAFKASNDVAEKFQDWLAIEVIPSIRKTGSYARPKNQLEILQIAVNELTSQDKRISHLEEHMRIDGAQEYQINQLGKKKVIKSLGGYKSPAYQDLSGKLFARFWRDFKQHFMIPRYSELPRKRFDEAIEFINAWQPDTSTRLEIQSTNRQQTMQEVI